MFGALLGRLSNVFTGAGVLWVGDTGARELARAVEYMRSGQSPSARAPHWEQQLLRVGPSVVIGVGSALMGLVTLFVVGGALAWLAIHGYGLPLMLLAVVVGAVIGGRRARLVRKIPPPDRMN
jgi:hypothetical protein